MTRGYHLKRAPYAVGYSQVDVALKELGTKDTTMTDWQKAKEAAIDALVEAVHQNVDRIEGFDATDAPAVLQAALDALKAHGYLVVPEKPSEGMYCAGDEEIITALNELPAKAAPTPAQRSYTAMITAAQKEMG